MFAWFGSANLTGAGMGAKPLRKRNFENGVVTDDQSLIGPLENQFDAVWRNAPAAKLSGSPTSGARSLAQQGRKRVRSFCADCGRKDFCPDPIVG